jgi:glutamate-1-semialdehyde 2,1-aminomutase
VALRAFPRRGLYVLFERSYVPPEPERAEALLAVCLEEGACVVQYRDKRPPATYDLDLLRRLAALCRGWGVPFLVNDHPEVAVRATADGVHLGRDDPPPSVARDCVGEAGFVGVSCYADPERARAAESAGADYVAFGSFFPSRTKPGAVRAEPDVLVRARAWTALPLVAIGGIDESNAEALLAAGADLLAVAGALFAEPSPAAVRARARRLCALFPREGGRARAGTGGGRRGAVASAPRRSGIMEGSLCPTGGPMNSTSLYARASAVLVGGVDSPVRAFGAVGGEPLFVARGKGAEIVTEDGRSFIDCVASWGAVLLGHGDPTLVEAVSARARYGFGFGAPHTLETELAERMIEAVPTLERVRFVCSGTEATMTAVRLARAVTGHDLVVKFAGCYHGHADPFLVAAGSGALTLGRPSSPGVPKASAALTAILPYNDATALEALFAREGGRIAAVIVEPIAGNMGVIPSDPDFRAALASIPRRHGALLILDEVMTGFRVARGGAQELLDLRGDLVTYGKVIGGGLPVGALAGPADLMARLAPLGPVYQAGTLAGNPLAMAAGVSVLARADAALYARLAERTKTLAEGLRSALARSGVAGTVQAVPGMWTLFLGRSAPVRNGDDVQTLDRELYARFFHRMLDEGVYLPPSPFEAAFLTDAHTPAVIERIVAAAERALVALG